MELYGQYSKSVPQKIVVHVLEILLLWGAFWILFQAGGDWAERNLSIPNAVGQFDRRMLVFGFHVVTFLRLGYMMIVLLRRKIPWEESISVPFAFALYYIGFSLLVLPTTKPLDMLDFVAVLLFVAGSVLNSGGEILRDRWKKNPVNKGK